MIKKLGFFFLFFAWTLIVRSQNSSDTYFVSWKGSLNAELQSILKPYTFLPKDSSLLSAQLSQAALALRKNGYIAANLGKTLSKGDSLLVSLFPGPKYKVQRIQLDSLSPLISDRTFQKWVDTQPSLDWEGVESRLSQLLPLFPEKGYPFAQFIREDVTYVPGDSGVMNTRLTYRFDTGPQVHINRIQFTGNVQDKVTFLQAIAGIFPGDVYRQSRIESLQTVLRNTRYFEEVGIPQVTFTKPDEAEIEVALSPTKRGQFDAVLGILPPSEGNEKLQLVGLVQLALISPTGFGEFLSLDYQSLRASSQQLDIEVEFPYLFKQPFGIRGNLHMLKQEEDFLNVDGLGSLVYYIRPNFSVEGIVSQQGSRLLELGANLADSSSLLVADGNRRNVGVRVLFDNLDFPFNSTKGISLALEGYTGTRTIRKNPEIPEEKYTGIPLSQNSWEIRWDVKAFFPLGRRTVIHAALKGFHLEQDRYFQNDQILVGGSRSLRGFNENEFFTDSYQQLTLEWRLLLERESNLFIFADYASLRNKLATESERLFPLGFGLGMNYGTKVGILSLSYGIGRARGAQIPFEASRGKIHVGLVSRF